MNIIKRFLSLFEAPPAQSDAPSLPLTGSRVELAARNIPPVKAKTPPAPPVVRVKSGAKSLGTTTKTPYAKPKSKPKEIPYGCPSTRSDQYSDDGISIMTTMAVAVALASDTSSPSASSYYTSSSDSGSSSSDSSSSSSSDSGGW